MAVSSDIIFAVASKTHSQNKGGLNKASLLGSACATKSSISASNYVSVAPATTTGKKGKPVLSFVLTITKNGNTTKKSVSAGHVKGDFVHAITEVGRDDLKDDGLAYLKKLFRSQVSKKFKVTRYVTMQKSTKAQ